MKKLPILLTGTALISIAGMSFAQEPAVVGPNAKLKLGYSSGEDDGGFLTGSYTAPVLDQFGFQLDIGYDDAGNSSAALGATKGAALHMFYRDPNRYLIGAYAHTLDTNSSLGDLKNTRLAVETEFYLDDITLEAMLGKDNVSIAGSSLDYDLMRFAFGYFINDNMRITATYEDSFDLENYGLHLENKMMLGSQEVGLFLSHKDGDAGDVTSFGATFYFGTNGLSLKDAQRKADPSDKFDSPSRNGLYEAEIGARSEPKYPYDCIACPY